MDKIFLTEERETLLIPLYGKAKENEKEKPVLVDEKAVEIVSHIDYNFKSLKIPEKTNIMMCIRAKIIDNLVKDFLAESKENTALHLGCGLDSRYYRIGNSGVDWYDVDFKEVIDIRKAFYEETNNYHLIASSVTESGWIEKIPQDKKQYIVVAEGLFMYLKEDEIKTLISRLKERVGCFTLIFDAYSTLTAKSAKNHPSIKKTGAKIHWGIDNPLELTKWESGIKFIEEKYFTSSDYTRDLDAGTKVMFKIANLFPVAKKAHRILIYKIG